MAGGSSTPKQKPSAQEIAQAQAAAERWNERIDDGYLALEREGVADAQRDHSGYIGGRASANLAREEAAGLRQLIGTNAQASDINSFGRAVAEAEGLQDVDTAQQAQALRDGRMLEMAKVGNDVAATASSGLRQAANLGHSRAQTKLESKILEDNSRFAAGLSAASGAVSGLALRNEGYRLTGNGLERTHNRGLFNAAPLSQEELEKGRGKAGNRISFYQLMAGS